jgi:hypothetical protein
MHDLLIAIVFVSLVASPALVAVMPLKEEEDDSNGLPERATRQDAQHAFSHE